MISAMLRAAARLVFALLCALVIAACGSTRDAGPPPVALTRPKKPPEAEEGGLPPPEDWDFWVRELRELMSPAEVRAHLALPADRRLRERHARLLDLAMRKRILDGIRERLRPGELTAFRGLDTLIECQKFADAVLARSP